MRCCGIQGQVIELHGGDAPLQLLRCGTCQRREWRLGGESIGADAAFEVLASTYRTLPRAARAARERSATRTAARAAARAAQAAAAAPADRPRGPRRAAARLARARRQRLRLAPQGPLGSAGMDGGGRVYGGRSESERRADRRARLLEAGLALFGTEGWAGTSIERLCTTAGVATRSFYEEHSGREQLLLAVYDEVLAGAAQAVIHAVEAAGDDERARAHAGVAAYVGHLTEDPRRAQVVNQEVRAAGSTPPGGGTPPRHAHPLHRAGLARGPLATRPTSTTPVGGRWRSR